MGKQGTSPQQSGGSLPAKGIYMVEKHQEKNGKLIKIKGYVIAENFIPVHMTKEESCKLMEACDDVYDSIINDIIRKKSRSWGVWDALQGKRLRLGI
jgi:hypothetical protein